MGLALGPTRRSLMFTTVPERMTRFAGRPPEENGSSASGINRRLAREAHSSYG